MKEESAWYLIAEDGEGKPVACVHFRFDIDCDDAVLYWFVFTIYWYSRTSIIQPSWENNN